MRRPSKQVRAEDLRGIVAAADKLAKAGIIAFTFGGTVNWHVMRLMDEILETACGAEKHDALMTMKANWAEEPCATKAFEEFHRWTSQIHPEAVHGHRPAAGLQSVSGRPRRDDAGRRLARRTAEGREPTG